MTRWRTLTWSVAILVLPLTSCASTAPIVVTSTEVGDTNLGLTAQISGMLTAKDGCVYLVPPRGPAVLPVFGADAVTQGEAPQIWVSVGAPTASVGDEVTLTGGFAPEPAIAGLRERLDIPSSCATEAGIFLVADREG